MKNATQNLLLLTAALTLTACTETTPVEEAEPNLAQPERGAAAAKSDGLSQHVQHSEARESLRSRALRAELCEMLTDTADLWSAPSDAQSFGEGCVEGHSFTVTGFYNSTQYQDDQNRQLLLALDVEVDAAQPQGYRFRTRLVRTFDGATLQDGWRPLVLSSETPGGEACEDPTALALTAVEENAALRSALGHYNDTCAGTGEWCEITDHSLYALPTCLDPATDFESIVRGAIDAYSADIGGPLSVLRGNRNPSVRELPAAQVLDATAGAELLSVFPDADQALGFEVESEVPCHNCTEFETLTVLLFPESQRVLVLLGTRGYDS